MRKSVRDPPRLPGRPGEPVGGGAQHLRKPLLRITSMGRPSRMARPRRRTASALVPRLLVGDTQEGVVYPIETYPAVEDARVLQQWIKRRQFPQFTKRDAHRAHEAHFKKSEDLDAPLRILEDRGFIRAAASPAFSPKGGRPASTTYQVHPDLIVN